MPTSATSHPEFLVSTTQLGAAAALSGIRIESGSPLPALPASVQPPLDLAGSPLLDKTGRKLTPHFEAALQALADPERVLKGQLGVIGKERLQTISLAEGKSAPRAIVSLAPHPPEGFRIRVLGTVEEAALELAGALQFTESPERPKTAGDVTLTLAAYTTLLASVDGWHSLNLRTQLSRSAPIKPVLNAGYLEKFVVDGMVYADNRWAVAASQSVYEAELEKVSVHLDAGLTVLHGLGLVRPVQRGYVFTPEGEAVAEVLAQAERVSHLSLELATTVARSTLFHGPRGGFWFKWEKFQTATETTLRMAPLMTSGLIAYTQELFALKTAAPPKPGAADPERKDSPQACPRCHAKAPPRSRFCPECGAVLASPPPSPAPTPCPNPSCGQPIAPGKKFCTACGTKVLSANASQ
ncbi:MAG: zinc ribbon domain-containing protein [Opitutaceae bacterium]